MTIREKTALVMFIMCVHVLFKVNTNQAGLMTTVSAILFVLLPPKEDK